MTIEELPKTVYHGTISVYRESLSEKIDITKSYKFTDFGQGFYTTTGYEQAKKFAVSRTNLYNKRHKETAYPMVVELEIDHDILNRMKGRIFGEADEHWAEFVFNNRLGEETAVSNCYNDPNHIRYHYVYGNVADSGVSNMVGLVRIGKLGFGEFVKRIQQLNSNEAYDQFSFHSDNALKALTIKRFDIIEEE